MTERRQLGAILLESGRITDEDVRRVLEHQRVHGGFFGQALVALGMVSREEIDWALASQFDLPFIFPARRIRSRA
jgi:type IV pilus assembly protein PilB